MYIPSLLFGQANTCISGSGFQETGEFISGSVVWKYFKFTTQGSGSFVIDSGSTTNARVFLVGGGGGGGKTEFNGEALNESAGGGGGGGIVYTDYRLGPGTYTYYVGDGGTETNFGEDTWIEMEYLPSDYPYYAPTGSRLTAEGGGFGAYFLSPNSPNSAIDAGRGGSGGGGCNSLRYVSGYLKANRGGGRVAQGNRGGDADGPLCAGSTETTATGGGGAGGQSDDTNCINQAGYQTPGGNGKFYIVDGTNTEYSCGGASMRKGTWEAATNDTQLQASRMYGAGGWGNSDSYTQSTKRNGRPGIMVILVPVCRTNLFDCTTYQFDGGASGGDITYIPCGESYLQTDTVNFGQTGSFCTYPITGDYPTTTGTVSLTATGSCFVNQDIPTLPTCSVGEVTANAYTYDIEIPTACYPTPSSCQQVREAPSIVTYTKFDGTAVIQSIGGGTGNGQYSICAREYPSPTLSCGSVGGSSTPCSITKTSNICGYYCTSSV